MGDFKGELAVKIFMKSLKLVPGENAREGNEQVRGGSDIGGLVLRGLRGAGE